MSMYNGTGWTSMPDLPTPVAFPIFISFQGKLYRIGGQNATIGDMATVEYFNGVWNTVSPSMLVARVQARAIITSDGRNICVAGGTNGGGSTTLATVECFDGSGWTAKPTMGIARSAHGLVNYRGDNVCAIGGIGTGNLKLGSWECQVNYTQPWLPMGNALTFPRHSFGAMYLPEGLGGFGTICVAGGIIQNGSLTITNSMECLTGSNTWKLQIPLMVTARYWAPLVVHHGLYCMMGGYVNASVNITSMECYNSTADAWEVQPGALAPRWAFGATNYDPPTKSPTRFPTLAPTTAVPTSSPTTTSPTSVSPSTQGPSRSPTSRSPTSTSPTNLPTVAPTLSPCSPLAPVDNGKGSCNLTPHNGNCTQTCPFGVATGDEFRRCLNGNWGNLVCNSETTKVVSSSGANIATFPVDSWQGILLIVAICVVSLCLLIIVYACSRRRCYSKEKGPPPALQMTALPPYTDQGDFVFPEPDNNSDPFEANKPVPAEASQASLQAAAEKVRKEQQEAYEQAQKSRGSQNEEGKHEAGSPGYGGISRLTVT